MDPIEKFEGKREAFEMWCLRRIERIIWKDKLTNDRVIDSLKAEINFLFGTEKRKCSYFGHIKRGKIFGQIMQWRAKFKAEDQEGDPETSGL